MKCACSKHLVCYYLWEIEKNDPVTEVRKWNVINVSRSVEVAWNSNLKTVICILLHGKKEDSDNSDCRQPQEV
jgi:hypothetical protein